MRFLSTLVLFSLFISSISLAQTAEEIVKKYVEKRGGTLLLTKLSSLKQVESIKAESTNYQTVSFYKGLSYKAIFSYEGMEIIASYDGKMAWATNPMTMKSEPLTEEDAHDLIEQGKDFPDPLFKASKNRYQIIKKDDETVNGNPCFKLTLLKPDYTFMETTIKGEVDFYIEKNSFLLVKSVAHNGNGKMETLFSNFKEKGGIIFPFNSKLIMNGIPTTTTDIQSIEPNPKINSAIFIMGK